MTGWILPSAAFEAKFVKSAGKIWRNMKRHAAYIADAVASGAGGLAGGGGGAAAPRRDRWAPRDCFDSFEYSREI